MRILVAACVRTGIATLYKFQTSLCQGFEILTLNNHDRQLSLRITIQIILACLLPIAAAAAIAQQSGPSAAASRIDAEVSVDEILANHQRAVRRGSRLNGLQNIDLVLQISESGDSLIARYRASADGYMRIDVFSNATRVYSEGKDTAGVWEWASDQDAPKNVQHDGVGAIEHGIEFNLFTLAELGKRGHNIELVGRETLRDQDYFVLRLTLSDGFDTLRYVNAATWLTDASRDFRALHPGNDSRKKHLETRYDKWAEANGIVSARRERNIDLDAGTVLGTTRVLAVAYDVNPESLDLRRTYIPGSPPAIPP